MFKVTPTLNDDEMRKILLTVFHANPEEKLRPGELMFIFCGQNNDFKATLAKRVPKKTFKGNREIILNFVEWEVEERGERIKDETCFRQDEVILVASMATIKLPNLQKLHFSGTNRGCSWFPVTLPSWTDPKAMMAVTQLDEIMVGRKQGGGTADQETVRLFNKKFLHKGQVVGFPHKRSKQLDEEIVHSYALDNIIEYYPGDGDLAVHSAREGKNYVGCAFNSAHKKMIEAKLDEVVFDGLGKPGSRFFRQAFADQMAEIVQQHQGPDSADVVVSSADGREGEGSGNETGERKKSEESEEESEEEERDTDEEGEESEEEEEEVKPTPATVHLFVVHLPPPTPSPPSSSPVPLPSHLFILCLHLTRRPCHLRDCNVRCSLLRDLN